MEKMNNKKNSVLLSIIIPFHNRINLLKKTINSIKPFINSNYEIILVDDGSEKNLYSELSSYIRNNIYYFKIKNAERGYARNYGASKANGIYLNFFDSDDLALSNHITSFESFIKKNKYPNIFSNSYIVKNYNKNTNKTFILNGKLNKKIFFHNILSCNSVFIKKEVFNKYKFCEDKNLSGSEDWDLWLRVASFEEIIGNREVSSILIDHSLRSTRTQELKKINTRIDTLYQRVQDKKIFNLGNNLNYVKSEIYSFKTLVNASLIKYKLYSIKFLILSVYFRPFRIFEKRTLVILKKIITDFI